MKGCKYTASLLIWAMGLGLLLLGVSVPGDASELLDLLRKKGTITEKEYRELKADEKKKEAKIAEQIKKSEPPFKIKYDKGFRIVSKDKQHEFRLGVQVFSQFSVFPEDTDANNNFRIRRGRVTFRGKVFRDWTYRLELDGTDDAVLDQDAYFGWEKHKQFRIRVGQHKTRFGGEQTSSRYGLFFLERSMISDNLTEGSSRGVFVYGQLHPMFGYQASVSNGTGRNNDNNSEKDYALRLTLKPFTGTPSQKTFPVEISGNFSAGDQPNSGNGARTRLFLRDNRLVIFNAATEGLRQRYGGDIWYNKAYKNKGGIPLSATAEFIYERQEREGLGPLGGKGDDVIRYGYHVQGGYMLMGSRSKNGLELVAKYERIDADDESGGNEDLTGQTLDTYGLGLNYWPIKEVRLSANGFLFDFDRPLTTEADKDPFRDGDSAWAVIFGFYFKF